MAVGLLLAVASLPILLHFVAQRGGHGQRGRRQPVRHDDDPAVPVVSTLYHALPAGLRQALVQPARPCGDLPVHRRQLHALSAGRAARAPGAGRCSASSGARPRWAWWPSSSTGCAARCGPPGCTWRWAGWQLIAAVPLFERLPAAVADLAGRPAGWPTRWARWSSTSTGSCATATSSGTCSCWRARPATSSRCCCRRPEPAPGALSTMQR